MHSAPNASIYRFPNNGPHFKAEVVDPQKFLPNWLVCRDIVVIFVP